MIRIRGASPHGDDPSHCKEPQKITDPLLEVDILKSKRKRRKKKKEDKGTEERERLCVVGEQQKKRGNSREDAQDCKGIMAGRFF